MEKNKIILSVALAVLNEEKNLASCLESIVDIADEIIIVDGGSTDKTIAEAQKYHAKIIRTSNPPIFHINKQKALDACKGLWILQLDADEVVSDALKNEIIDVVKKESGLKGYAVARKNYFLDTWLKKGGQYPDYVIRLVRKGYAKFPCKSVHEQIQVDGEVGHLQNPLLHYSYRTLSEYWKKADAYTSLTAGEMYDSKMKPSFPKAFLYFFVKPLKTFLLLYFRHKGCLDGVNGFRFALFSSLHHAIAYKKFLSLYSINTVDMSV
jgi:glycosyltransferase involved in cell wall biosynthesis